MRIAQVSPLEESVPPKTYGGTERVVSYLTNELLKQGHDVTLFASGDSTIDGRLIPVCPEALRFDKSCQDKLALHIVELKNVIDRSHEFDIIHFHIDYIHLPAMCIQKKPYLTTLHGRQDIRELSEIYRAFPNTPLVSISNAQRKPLPIARWAGTVYHGLPKNLFRFRPSPGPYLAFLGRMSPEKRVDRAIEIAKACRIPLKIAAKVDAADRAYFEKQIRPLLDDPLIEFIGEINEAQKDAFLGEALALLFPIDWPEPFGLVMIEAMACGTPVIAFRQGSVPEIIRHGTSGFIVDTVAEAVEAVHKVHKLPRIRCFQEFSHRFTSEQMTKSYLSIYEELISATARRKAYPFPRDASDAQKVQHL